MRSINVSVVLTLVAAGIGSCSDEPIRTVSEDGRDDRFMVVGKADDFSVPEGSPEACGVLNLVNQADAAWLKDEVGISTRASNNIYNHRTGPDGLVQTGDDDPFDSLAELDAVPWVGPRTFETLLAYVTSHGYICGSNLSPDCNGTGGTYKGVGFTQEEECQAVEFINRAKWSDMKGLSVAARKLAYFCRPVPAGDGATVVECGMYRPLDTSLAWRNLAEFSSCAGVGATSLQRIKSAAAGFTAAGEPQRDTVAYVWNQRALLKDAPVLFEQVYVTKRVEDEAGTSAYYYCVELRDGPGAPNWIHACMQAVASDAAPACASGPGCLDGMVGRWVQVEGTVRKSSWHPGGYKINLAKEPGLEAHPGLPPGEEDAQCREAWCALSREGAPADRTEHASVWTGAELVVWGGRGWSNTTIPGGSLDKPLDDGARYLPGEDAWIPVSQVGAPAARYAAATVWTGEQMIVWGGTNGSDLLGDGGRYDPASDSWTPLSGDGAPDARRDPMTAWTGSEIIVWGGTQNGEALGSGARYHPASDTWTPMGAEDSPAPRVGAIFAWTGEEFLVWGGGPLVDYPPCLNNGALYNPLTDTWRPVFDEEVEFPCIDTAFAWSGSELVVWACGANIYDPALDQWLRHINPAVSCGLSGPQSIWAGDRLFFFGRRMDRPGGGPLDLWFGSYDPEADSLDPPVLPSRPGERHASTLAWTGKYLIIWGGEVPGGVSGTGVRLQFPPGADSCSQVEPGDGGEGEPCADTDQCDGLQYCNLSRCVCYPPGECVQVSDCASPGNGWTHDVCDGQASCTNGLCTWMCNPQ